MSLKRTQSSQQGNTRNLFQFLENIDASVWSRQVAICLYGVEYSMLCSAALLNRFKSAGLPIESLDLEEQSIATVTAQLEMSFLGIRKFYWLRNVAGVPAKERKQLIAYLERYTGPHGVLFFVSHDTVPTPPSAWFVITLEKVLTQQQFVHLMTLEYPTAVRRSAPHISRFFANQATIALDNAYMLMRYLNLIGEYDATGVAEWLNDLLTPEQSLFTLSTQFFARDTRKFFATWALMRDMYGEPFWLAFWSEQLWRAANYIALMERREMVEAKKVGFRLPFSFMQRDWKKTSVHELIQAHDCIYALDYGLKNGGEFWMELFYTKFFESGFTTSR